MEILDSFLDATGDTPLVRLGRVTAGVKPTILAKLEMLNPGGSVKDRIGLRMMEAAEREGRLKPGGTIVEPTSGNTGHGLAIAAAIRGYRCIFVMPDKMSQEKVALLRAYGAEVIITPTAVAPESPESYYRVADRLTEEIPGAFQPNQYFNQENPQAHYETTGPEIWEQTEVARELPADAVVVVIFPDTGRNYLSKLYSDTWMLQYGFIERAQPIRVSEVLAAKHGELPELITVRAHDKVRQAVDVLQEHGISQAPVVREEGDDVALFVGSIRERELLDRVFRDPDSLQADVAEVMGPPIPLVEHDDPVEVAFSSLQDAPAGLG